MDKQIVHAFQVFRNVCSLPIYQAKISFNVKQVKDTFLLTSDTTTFTASSLLFKYFSLVSHVNQRT